MDYTDSAARRVVVDLETDAINGVEPFIKPRSAPGNYKDADKIAAWQTQDLAKQIDRAALDPALCQIVCLGWQLEGETTAHSVVLPDETAEFFQLEKFWQVVGDRTVVTFNGFAFDLPVLIWRSYYHGLRHRPFSLNKYRPQGREVDLALLLTPGGCQMHTLDFYCQRFGIATDDTVSGADVPRLVAEGSWELIEAHCRADVEKTAKLADKLGQWRTERESKLQPVGDF